MITDCLKLSDDDYVIGGRQRMSFSINEVARVKNVAFLIRFGMFNKRYQKPAHTLCHVIHEVSKYEAVGDTVVLYMPDFAFKGAAGFRTPGCAGANQW